MLDYASFPDERQVQIKKILGSEGRVSSVKLARELHVSEHTIRRDLQELAKAGICKKVYGGAVSCAPLSTDFSQRIEIEPERKLLLGKACAKQLKDGGCVFLDGGSTNFAVAKSIPESLSLTVVTNSPTIAQALLGLPKCEVIIIGGRVNKNSGTTLGVTPLHQIEGMYFDQCVLGACALDINEGLTVFGYEDAEIKKTLIQKSDEVIVALTSNKINSVARYKVANCEEISNIIFEQGVPEEKLSQFRENNIRVYTATENTEGI